MLYVEQSLSRAADGGRSLPSHSAVVALFLPLDHAVAAAGVERAVVAAIIGVHGVAIVALLAQAGLGDAVAAALGLAGVAAAILAEHLPRSLADPAAGAG